MLGTAQEYPARIVTKLDRRFNCLCDDLTALLFNFRQCFHEHLFDYTSCIASKLRTNKSGVTNRAMWLGKETSWCTETRIAARLGRGCLSDILPSHATPSSHRLFKPGNLPPICGALHTGTRIRDRFVLSVHWSSSHVANYGGGVWRNAYKSRLITSYLQVHSSICIRALHVFHMTSYSGL